MLSYCVEVVKTAVGTLVLAATPPIAILTLAIVSIADLAYPKLDWFRRAGGAKVDRVQVRVHMMHRGQQFINISSIFVDLTIALY